MFEKAQGRIYNFRLLWSPALPTEFHFILL